MSNVKITLGSGNLWQAFVIIFLNTIINNLIILTVIDLQWKQ